MAGRPGRPRHDDDAAGGVANADGPRVPSGASSGKAPQSSVLLDAERSVSGRPRQVLSAGRARRVGGDVVRSGRPRVLRADRGPGDRRLSAVHGAVVHRGGLGDRPAPRATGGHRRWPMAASLAAIMSGCFVASANRRSYDSEAFAGRSWLVSPEGEILGETSADAPFLTAEVDLVTADRAKQTYPRNLRVP